MGQGDLQHGAAVLNNMINHRASQMGFNDIFFLLGWIFRRSLRSCGWPSRHSAQVRVRPPVVGTENSRKHVLYFDPAARRVLFVQRGSHGPCRWGVQRRRFSACDRRA